MAWPKIVFLSNKVRNMERAITSQYPSPMSELSCSPFHGAGDEFYTRLGTLVIDHRGGEPAAH